MRTGYLLGTRGTALYAMAPLLLLTGCVSFGSKAPTNMLVLTAENSVKAGQNSQGTAAESLVIQVPEAPRKLATNRIAVQASSGTVAYLKDGIWADRPANLFQQLLSETISSTNTVFVLSEAEAAGKARQQLSGQLVELGIDPGAMEAVAVYDAVLIRKNGAIEKQRFESRIPILRIEGQSASPALNEAANKVAKDVADWVLADRK